MFALGQPGWLLLVIPLGVLAWRVRALGLLRPLRAVIVILLVLMLCEPRVRWRSEGLDLWVVLDRSASAEGEVAKSSREWLQILQSSKGTADRLFLVEFADGVQRVDVENRAEFSQSVFRTQLADALEYVAREAAGDRASRVLVFTDGLSTQPLGGLEFALNAAHLPVDYRLIRGKVPEDVQVDAVSAPTAVALGEPFLLEVRMSGSSPEPLTLEIRENERLAASAKVDLRGGRAVTRFAHRVSQPGAVRITASLQPPQSDPRPQNNAQHTWVDIIAPPRVVLLSEYEEDPVAAVLRREQIAVRVLRPEAAHIGELSGASCVIFNNVPASRVPRPFQEGMEFYVRSQAGGLLMAGGKASFGSGGYFESPLDGLLPVSMELREEHRKLSVALAIVMDRSGSMAMSVGGTTKMQLANEGAARAIELLGDNDYVAVLAVDTASHFIVPMTQVGKNRAEAVARTRAVASMGGGIFVYTGLKDAWGELKKSPAGTRHVILFTDAADSEEPGEYVRLLEEMRRENATVSVIGLGTPTDPDVAFIEDVAARGGGRFFLNDNAKDLPGLFAQETVSVARSTFITETTAARPTGFWSDVSPQPLDFLRAVNGYNLCYLRPEARASLLSGDEYAAPLVAQWRRGAGRVAAVTFPLAGEFSNLARNWVGYPDLVLALTRWLAGERNPAGLTLRTHLDGTELVVEFYYDEGWTERALATPPQLMVNRGPEGGTVMPWSEMRPGEFRARIGLEPGEVLRGSVLVGETALPFGPVSVADSEEWRYEPGRIAELRALAAATGGEERFDLSTVWRAPRRETMVSLFGLLGVALIVAILADAFVTRWRGF